jgi:serine/threonine-protein kinase HipA
MNLLFEKGEGDLSDLARRLQGTGGSLGGARPKSAILDGEHLAIAKYTSVRDTVPVERMEIATLNLARETGLRASLARLELSESSFPVAVIDRFDRRGNERMHYVSARSFLGLQDDQDTSYYSDLAMEMKRHCGNSEQVIAELEELYRRILFTILVSNADDHLKNHGFLYSGNDRWQLSPAFDINPQPYSHAQLKTGISEASGFTASIEAAIEAAPLFEIDESLAAQMTSRMAKTINARWRYWCQEAVMSSRECDWFAPAFRNSEMNFALKLGRSVQQA